MIRDPQDAADELVAERAYADMLAHPETIVDAFDLFHVASTIATQPAFDLCALGRHYAACGRYTPFERCPFGSHWHHVDQFDTAYRGVGPCPNAGEHGEPAEQACEPPETDS